MYPVTESENLTFYKVSDTFWDTPMLTGAYVTVNGAEALHLPQTFEITADMLQTNYEMERSIIQVIPAEFPVILSITAGYDEYEQGVYALLAKAEDIQAMLGIPVENDVFAQEIATPPIVVPLPNEYLSMNYFYAKRNSNTGELDKNVLYRDEHKQYLASPKELSAALSAGTVCINDPDYPRRWLRPVYFYNSYTDESNYEIQIYCISEFNTDGTYGTINFSMIASDR